MLSFSQHYCFANFDLDLDNADFTPVLGCGQHIKDMAKMTTLVLQAEADSDGEKHITCPHPTMHHEAKSVALKISNKSNGLEVTELSNPDDSHYDSDMPSLQEISDDEGDEDDVMEISNEEVRLNGCL